MTTLTSASLTKLLPSLLKAQRALEGGVTKGAVNPRFGSKYADIASILEVVVPVLNDNEIVLLQPNQLDNNGNQVVATILMHTSGEYISSLTKVVSARENDPQALMGAVTYARRYGLVSILGLKTEDDDGNSATVAGPAKKVESKPAPLKAATTNDDGLDQKPVETPAVQSATTATKQSKWKKPGTATAAPIAAKAKPVMTASTSGGEDL